MAKVRSNSSAVASCCRQEFKNIIMDDIMGKLHEYVEGYQDELNREFGFFEPKIESSVDIKIKSIFSNILSNFRGDIKPFEYFMDSLKPIFEEFGTGMFEGFFFNYLPGIISNNECCDAIKQLTILDQGETLLYYVRECLGLSFSKKGKSKPLTESDSDIQISMLGQDISNIIKYCVKTLYTDSNDCINQLTRVICGNAFDLCRDDVKKFYLNKYRNAIVELLEEVRTMDTPGHC